MLRWLSDDAMVHATNAALGVADWRAAIGDQDWAGRNDHAQVLLTGLALAAWQSLAGTLGRPGAVAGYSVGELAACAVAGVFDPVTALSLARHRAEVMDACAAQAPGGLLGVSGIPLDRVHACIDAHRPVLPLHVAVRHAPFMVVLGGADAALVDAMQSLTAQGARCTRLKVAVASHTPAMRAASTSVAEWLAQGSLGSPVVPLFSCTGERVASGAAAARALAAQISTTVLWDDCLENVRARQVACVLEVGPGASLASMWNQRFPDVPARSVDEFEDKSAIVDWVRRQR